MALRPNSQPTRQLPANPSVENLKKQAKSLLRAHRRSDACSCGILRRLPRYANSDDAHILSSKVGLREAQQALAMDYGHTDWVELMVRAEGNEGVVRAVVRAANQGTDIDSILDKYCSPDYVFHEYGRDVSLSEARAYLKRAKALALRLGGIHVKASLDEMSSSGDQVLYTVSHPGVPFSGAKRHRMVLESRFVGGKVVETWQREGVFPAIPDVDTPGGQLEIADILHDWGRKLKAVQWARSAVASGLPKAILTSLGFRPSADDVRDFFSQCLDGLNNDTPLLRILYAMHRNAARSIRKRAITRVVKSIGELIEAGLSFSEALAHHPDVFDTSCIAMIQVGESGSRMEDQLARMLDQRVEVREPVVEDLHEVEAILAAAADAMNQRDTDALARIVDTCWAKSFAGHFVDIVRTGNRDESTAYLLSCIRTLPDLSIQITDITRRNHVICAAWSISGTLTLPGVGHETKTTARGTCRGRLENGKVVEGWIHGLAPMVPSQKDGMGLFNTARMLQNGVWLRKDNDAAKEWYARAKELGYPPEYSVEERDRRLKAFVEGDALLDVVQTSGPELAAPGGAIRSMNIILYQAIIDGATEILLSPWPQEKLGIMYDVLGNFWFVPPVPGKHGTHLINRLKVMAGVQPHDRAYPIEGKISIVVEKKTFDLRVIFDATDLGERAHITITRPSGRSSSVPE